MNLTKHLFLSKVQKHVVLAITFGNILEWYDAYLYIFWAPTISSLFFNYNSPSTNLIVTISFFTLGFILRPFGGIFFGRLGDRIGRRKAFILSILLMTIPTFVIGLLPIYSQIGIFSPMLLALVRALQTFPAGGELPGAFCYLYENANHENRKFMTSFAGVGNQIGVALSAAECFLIERYLPSDLLLNWGWRASFIIGGFIGLGGVYLRYKLHETVLFHEMVIHHRMTQETITKIIKKTWKKIFTGISYGTAQTASFHFVSILLPIYIYKLIGMSNSKNLISTISLLMLTTLPLPLFGLLADKFGTKRLLIGSCIGMIGLLYPLYISIHTPSFGYAIWIMALFVLCFTCITALWPYVISNLFPTRERYTCIGLSFNMADGVLGGLSALIGVYLFSAGDTGSFIWILLVCCIISLTSFLNIKDEDH